MDVQTNKPLSLAVLRTRNGEVSGFEDFYLLTCANTFRDIRSFARDDEEAWELLEAVYQEIWKRHEALPETGIIRSWIRVVIRDVSKRAGGSVAEGFGGEVADDPIADADNRSAAALIAIEEREGILSAPRALPEKRAKGNPILAVGRFLLSLLLVGVSVFAAIFLLRMTGRGSVDMSDGASERTFSVVAQTETESVRLVPGWNYDRRGRKYLNRDGSSGSAGWFEDGDKLYYLDEEGYALQGEHRFGGQTFVFSEDGALQKISRTYGREKNDTILAVQLREFGHPEKTEAIIDDSIVLDNEWIYFLSAEEDADFPSLYRMVRGEDFTELIAEEVSGYILQSDFLWYSRGRKIEKYDKNERKIPPQDGYRVREKRGEWEMTDAAGQAVHAPSGYLDLDGRVYRVQDGIIKSVSAGPQKIDGYRFYCGRAGENPRIMRDQGKEYLRHGESVDALAVLGETLYYSVRLSRETGKTSVSQIWKVDIYTGAAAAVSGEFSGRVTAMYAYPGENVICMEYRPGGSELLYGRVAVIQSGQAYLLEDAEAGASTQLIPVWYEGAEVYCYKNECSDRISSDGTVEVLKSASLRLDTGKKEKLGRGGGAAGPIFADFSEAAAEESMDAGEAGDRTEERGGILSEDEMAEVNRTAEALPFDGAEGEERKNGEKAEAGRAPAAEDEIFESGSQDMPGQGFVEPLPQ